MYLDKKLTKVNTPYDIKLHFVSFNFSSLYNSIEQHCYWLLPFLTKTITCRWIYYEYFDRNVLISNKNAYFHIGFKRLFKNNQGLSMGSYDSADIANLVSFISEI